MQAFRQLCLSADCRQVVGEIVMTCEYPRVGIDSGKWQTPFHINFASYEVGCLLTLRVFGSAEVMEAKGFLSWGGGGGGGGTWMVLGGLPLGGLYYGRLQGGGVYRCGFRRVKPERSTPHNYVCANFPAITTAHFKRSCLYIFRFPTVPQ